MAGRCTVCMLVLTTVLAIVQPTQTWGNNHQLAKVWRSLGGLGGEGGTDWYHRDRKFAAPRASSDQYKRSKQIVPTTLDMDDPDVEEYIPPTLRHGNQPPTQKKRNPPTTEKRGPPTKEKRYPWSRTAKTRNPPTEEKLDPPTADKRYSQTILQRITKREKDKSTNDELSLAEEACSDGGRLITCKKGTVTSLGYPDNYPLNATCSWLLRAPEGQVIEVDFTDFSLGFGDCITLSYSNSAISGVYDPAVMSCGRQPPTRRKYTSVGNELQVALTTGVTGGGRGLLFDFHVRDPVECEDLIELVGSGGRLTSKGYPAPYSPRSNCQWRIVVPSDKKVKITFEDLAVEHARSCDYDTLTIFDGPSTSDARIDTYCGHTVPDDVIISSSNVVVVTLTADGSTENRGFALNWQVAR